MAYFEIFLFPSTLCSHKQIQFNNLAFSSKGRALTFVYILALPNLHLHLLTTSIVNHIKCCISLVNHGIIFNTLWWLKRLLRIQIMWITQPNPFPSCMYRCKISFSPPINQSLNPNKGKCFVHVLYGGVQSFKKCKHLRLPYVQFHPE